jgi:hypothetical protein
MSLEKREQEQISGAGKRDVYSSFCSCHLLLLLFKLSFHLS